ncbi:Abi family protein, partial [Ellagibacter isourolithinifaciens]|uniref:Abi family protein n=1 Tax=Ellagibacter isourolithinifaciens TaxID=2137581 RepID=UPI002E77C86E
SRPIEVTWFIVSPSHVCGNLGKTAGCINDARPLSAYDPRSLGRRHEAGAHNVLLISSFKYFAIAEEALKTTSAYCFSEAHIGEKEPYLDASSYDTSPNQIGLLLSDFNTALGRKPHRKPKRKLYLEHYSKNHDEVPIWVLMKYLTLGQAFKFYCFQPESIRNEIAKAFSSLYANDHEKPIRISPRRLRLAYDHIKDFRNICAHDERFYCAKTSPSRDIAVTEWSTICSSCCQRTLTWNYWRNTPRCF